MIDASLVIPNTGCPSKPNSQLPADLSAMKNFGGHFEDHGDVEMPMLAVIGTVPDMA
ncbi:hypothetical protein LJC22_02075 [Desulfosarcina sp. OttesenSCG-928-G10]|nr:hypothetical protein [Desulfosarcina sp. OttesenSCG-928-G10]